MRFRAPVICLFSPFDRPLVLRQGYVTPPPRLMIRIKKSGEPGLIRMNRRGARSFASYVALTKLEQVAVIVSGRTALFPVQNHAGIFFTRSWRDFALRYFWWLPSREP